MSGDAVRDQPTTGLAAGSNRSRGVFGDEGEHMKIQASVQPCHTKARINLNPLPVGARAN